MTNIVDVVPVGFELPEYAVGESIGSVLVCVRANGQLGRPKLLMLSTADGTAIGKCW